MLFKGEKRFIKKNVIKGQDQDGRVGGRWTHIPMWSRPTTTSHWTTLPDSDLKQQDSSSTTKAVK